MRTPTRLLPALGSMVPGTTTAVAADLNIGLGYVSVSAAYPWTKNDVRLEAGPASPTGPTSFETGASIRAWIIGIALQKRFHFGRA